MTESLRTQLLLKNIYQESKGEKLEVTRKLMKSDDSFRREYLDMMLIISKFPRINFAPPSGLIEGLIDYNNMMLELDY